MRTLTPKPSTTNTTREYIDEQIALFNESINTSIFIEAKDILNKYFGEENNQIVKPNFEDIHSDVVRSLGIPNYTVDQIERGISSENITRIFKKCYALIKFPDFTITNSTRGKGHVIKELWVKIYIDHEFRMSSSLYGTRSLITYQEAEVGYLHSHLGTRSFTDSERFPGWGQFCLGTGEINQVMKILSINGFDSINFTLFCLHLKNYVVWESLEGAPHISYDSVGLQRPTRRAGNDVENVLNSFGAGTKKAAVEFLKSKIIEQPIAELEQYLIPVIERDEVTIEMTDELQIKLAGFIQYMTQPERRQIGIDHFEDLLCYRGTDGSYTSVRLTRRPTVIVEPKQPMFNFKDKPVYLKIEGINRSQTQNQQSNVYYIHPTIAASFTACFSTGFYEACFRNEEVIKKSSLENLLQITGPNLLPV